MANFLKALCKLPGIDCYDLMSAITGKLISNQEPFQQWEAIVHLGGCFSPESLLYVGKNCCLNASTVELFLQNEPQSTSTKNMIHLAQSKPHVFSLFNFSINLSLVNG